MYSSNCSTKINLRLPPSSLLSSNIKATLFAKQKTKFAYSSEGDADIPFPHTPFLLHQKPCFDAELPFTTLPRLARALGGGWKCRPPRSTKSQHPNFRGKRFRFRLTLDKFFATGLGIQRVFINTIREQKIILNKKPCGHQINI